MAYSRIASAGTTSSDASVQASFSFNSPVNASVGDTVIIAACFNGQIANITAPTMTGGSNTWNLDVVYNAASTRCHAVFSCTLTNAITTSTSLTITTGASNLRTLRRAIWAQVFDGDDLTFVDTVNTNNTTPVTNSIASGNMALGIMSINGTTSATGDSDTTNGTWSTVQSVGTTVGSIDTKIGTQYKITTGSGNQSWDANLGGTEAYSLLEYQPTAPPSSDTTKFFLVL